MVYRPPRKKALPGDSRASFPANRPSADPLEGPLQKAPGTDGDDLRGDDRHLVKVNQDFAEADFEDRAWLFWHNNRQALVWVVMAACLGVVVWQLWRVYQRHAVEQLQTAYQEVSGNGTGLLMFAHANAGETLSKVALLEAGDAFYKKAQFKDAAAAYGEAASAWGEEPYGQRAKLGRGMALVLSGDLVAGKQQLEAMANNALVLDTFRAEASYQLAVLALQLGDAAGAKTWVAHIQAIPNAGSWARQAANLVELAPILSASQSTQPTTGNAPVGPMSTIPTQPTFTLPGVTPTPAAPAPTPAPATPAPTTGATTPSAASTTPVAPAQ